MNTPAIQPTTQTKFKIVLIAIVVLVLVAGAVLAVGKQKARLAAETPPTFK